MSENIAKTGIPSDKLIESTLPSKERRASGPYVVVECWQEIPCNPCVASCPFGVIAEMININDIPEVDHDKCTGCGLCISTCPGIAIFVIDETYGSPNQALIQIPHEFVPLPEVGGTVRALSRDGSYICDAEVIKVKKTKSATSVLHLVIPIEYIMEVRAIEPLPMR